MAIDSAHKRRSLINMRGQMKFLPPFPGSGIDEPDRSAVRRLYSGIALGAPGPGPVGIKLMVRDITRDIEHDMTVNLDEVES